MLLELKPGVLEEPLIERLEKMGFRVVRQEPGLLALVEGVDSTVKEELFAALPGVKRALPLKEKQKLASKKSKSGATVIEVRGKKIGGGSLFSIAGPCSIESKEQLEACAKAAKESGASALRGGAYKPRTSPYEFQGMGEEGLKLLRDAGEKYGLVTVSEVVEASQIEISSCYVDILQVGARNMQNFALLKELGKVKNPILLKRGFAATYQDLLYAAEYIISSGNPNVILCERGIRTFETYTRNTFDLNAIPALKELTHLPVIADPSHATGRRSLVLPMARAAVAAGADGIIVEIHPDPDKSLTDAAQTIGFDDFAKLMREATAVHNVLEKIGDRA
jgi:3-deoxy-7-phosphoheptulonate synthase